jgi:cytochrome c biogenesis protein CcmG, thiol:disulfide interchange protein DsbE
MWWLGLPVLAVLLVVALAAADLLARPAGVMETVSTGTLAVGSPVPDFTTEDLVGAPVKLSSLRGRPVLVSFWATWCSACREDLPAIQTVAERYGSARVSVLLVDYGEADRAILKTYLTGLGIHLDSALDPAGTIARAYRVIGLPVSLLVTSNGDLAYIHAGALLPADLDPLLAPVVLPR